MKSVKILSLAVALAAMTACDPPANVNTNRSNSNMTNASNASTAPTAQNLTEVPRPQKIADMMVERGEQDNASPTLTVLEPKNGASVTSSTVKVRLSLGGDLKGYKTMKDPATGMGNHIHVILDNQPYEAYYNLEQEFELRNVADGAHTLRFFPSRPWHESYKDAGAFQMVKFTVANGGANAAQPTTTNANQMMSNANTTAPTPEGKEMKDSTGGNVDETKPLLTYSRPKGEYKGADADAIMLDFWLSNAKLQGDGGDYRVSYSVDGGEAKFIDKWSPIWLSGWSNGTHSVKLELVGKDGSAVDNGGYNTTTREFTVAK